MHMMIADQTSRPLTVKFAKSLLLYATNLMIDIADLF